jgi:hypothetical protein
MFAELMLKDPYRTYRILLAMLLGIPWHASDQDIHELIEGGYVPKSLISLSDFRLLSPLKRDRIIPRRTLREERLVISDLQCTRATGFSDLCTSRHGGDTFRGRNQG